MKWREVESTSIAAIGYDRVRCELGVEFRQSKAVYFYFDVPPEEHEAFMAAASKGEYLNRVLKARGHRYSGPHASRRRAA